MGSRLRSEERGSSFAAELVTMAIIGLTLFVLMSGLSTSSKGVASVEKRVSAQTLARRQMELIKEAEYSPNPTVVPYPAVASGDAYAVTIGVTYWLSPTGPFQETVPAEDSGLQRIVVSVYPNPNPVDPVFVLEDYKAVRQ